jgi:FkbM family methyltransferase
MPQKRQVITQNSIYLLRKAFYNTPLQHLAITGYIYDRVFSAGMPDLSKPVKFRKALLYVDPNDRSYVPALVGGYYEKKELDIFEKLAPLATTFLDIGANIGMYSVIAATENATLRCMAFEPVEENQILLKKNITLNKLGKQVTLVKSAVSNRNGKATIHLSNKLSGTHSLSVDRGGTTRTVTITSVDSYCQKKQLKPELIKIDVEGHEGSVFRGMGNTLKETPTIFMEYIPSLNKDMRELIYELSDVYKDCYVVDTVKDRVERISMNDIDQEKMYNIILSKNKQHRKVIESFMKTSKPGLKSTRA